MRLPSLREAIVVLGIALTALVPSASRADDVITFGTVVVDHLENTGVHTEAGFQYSVVGNGWELNATGSGDTIALFNRFNGTSGVPGDEATITKVGGGTFTFHSLEEKVGNPSSHDNEDVIGYLGAVEVGRMTLNDGPNVYTARLSPFAQPIDRLVIRVTSLAPPGGTARGIDNIVFNYVPEPASTSALALGALALVKRRR